MWDLEKLEKGNGSVLTTFELVPIMPPGGPVAEYMRDGLVGHGRPSIDVERVEYSVADSQLFYGVATACGLRAAKLFRRLFEMVRSMMAPQLMHFHA